MKWKIALNIFALLGSANAFGENLGISTYGNFNMYGTPDQIGRALNTLKESSMYSDEIGAWRIHVKKSDFESEKDALKRLCPDCIEVDPLPVPVPLPAPCNKQPTVQYKAVNAYGTASNLVSAMNNQNYLSTSDGMIAVQMMDVKNVTLMAEYMTEACPECIEVDPLPNPTPIVNPCQ